MSHLWACQPSVDFFEMDLPVTGGGPSYYITTFGFRTYWTGEAIFSSSSYVSAVSNDDWDDFDNVATTYYGETSPPEPNHDYDTDEEPPGEYYPYIYGPAPLKPVRSLVRGMAAAWPPLADGSAAQDPQRWSKLHKVPVPFPKNSNEIVGDLVAGLRRTRLDRRAGLQSLSLADGRLTVDSIQSVKSLGTFSDYFIVNFTDTKTGRLYAQATVSSEGLVREVRLVPESESGALVGSAEEARSMMVAGGLKLSKQPELVFAMGDIAATPFRPFYEARTRSGERVMLTTDGRAFALNAAPSHPSDKLQLRTRTGSLSATEILLNDQGLAVKNK